MRGTLIELPSGLRAPPVKVAIDRRSEKESTSIQRNVSNPVPIPRGGESIGVDEEAVDQ